MSEANAKQEAPKTTVIADVSRPDDDKVSDAQQKRLDEFQRTHVVPSGYSYSSRKGLHKTKAEK